MSQGPAALLLLVLPWLNPFAPAPSPAVLPWLVTLGCVALLLLLYPWRRIGAPAPVAAAWLLAALLSSAIALCQYFGVAGHFWPWMNGAAEGQAYANLRQPNQFASLTSIGLLALLWWAQRAPARGAASVGVAVAALLLACGNAATASRTGLLQWLLIAALALPCGGWRQPRVRLALVAALLGYALAVWLLPLLAGLDPARSGILTRFGGGGCGSRLVLWRNVLALIAERPWAGWGWGELDYAHFMHLYEGPRFCEILGNAHNLPLHLAVELGLPLAVLACGAVLWLVVRARPWRERDAARRLAWGVLAVIALHSLLEYPLWYGPFLLSAVLAVGLLVRPDAPMPVSGPGWLRRGAGALLLLAVTYAGWDYQRVSQLYLPAEQRLAAYREDPLDKVRGSWLFGEQVRFAELSMTPPTRADAEAVRAMALALLHYSPEPRVVEKLIESDVLLGRDQEALFFLARYRAAFPEAHARWAAEFKARP